MSAYIFSAKAWNELLDAVGHDEQCPLAYAFTDDVVDDGLRHLALHLRKMREQIEEKL